jgi:hypothetical protein
MHLKHFLEAETDIIGASYFNTDYTYGLNHPFEGEADRAAINLRNDKTYYGIFDLITHAEKNEETLLNLFKTKAFVVDNKKYFIREEQLPSLITFSRNMYEKYPDAEELFNELILRQQRIEGNSKISAKEKEQFLSNIAILKSLNRKPEMLSKNETQ